MRDSPLSEAEITNCELSGDGLCDDKDNVEQCNYDGGDCCLIGIFTDFCLACICCEDETRHPDYHSLPENKCTPPWLGDGYCDEDLNAPECNFDSGDCCLPIINDKYCYTCTCFADNTKHVTLKEGDFPFETIKRPMLSLPFN